VRPVRIFLSSPADVAEERFIARGVSERLQGEFAGHLKLETVFWELEPLLATTDFQSQIPSPADCDIFVAILWSRLGSPPGPQFRRADGNPYASGTEYELDTALQARAANGRPDILIYRKTAAPVIKLEDDAELLERIEQKRALAGFFEHWFAGNEETAGKAFHRFATASEFEELLEAHLRKLLLRMQEEAPERPRQPAAWSRGSPFRGLQTFEFEHAPVFFGRTRANAEVLDALQQQAAIGRAFVLVLGMSGVGKSSLIRAGVLPMLTRPGTIRGVTRWLRATCTPADVPGEPLVGLARAMLHPAALPVLADVGDEATLATMLAEHPASVPPLLRAALGEDPAHLALLVDQLEELFTDNALTLESRRKFCRALSVLAGSGSVWIVATLRSDFYPHCEELPELMALKEGRSQYDLAPPTREEISQMIRLPAQAAGLSFEEDRATGVRLDDVLRDQACANPEMLPLLEFTLEELYQRRSEDGLLNFAAYEQIGGVEGSGCT